MSAAKHLSAVTPNTVARSPFKVDAALPRDVSVKYTNTVRPWAEVRAAWAGAIAAEKHEDKTVVSPYDLSVDPRDGALCRGGGGLAYTPHAWGQLYSLMGCPYPKNTAAADRWHSPRARALNWEDIKARGTRPREDKISPEDKAAGKFECIMRTFIDPRSGLRAARAIVSGRHSLEAFDDVNVIAVLEEMDALSRENNDDPARRIKNASVTRRTDHTWASFEMAAVEGASLGFGMTNSETNSASLSFYGHVRISVIDSVLRFPATVPQDVAVQVAMRAGLSRRRHTLPRFDSRTGDRLSQEARTAIAASRIDDDIEKALAEAAILADRWLLAKLDISAEAAALCGAIAAAKEAGDDVALKECTAVLGDILKSVGINVLDKDMTPQLIEMLADPSRLRELPVGSAAHMAGALAVLARSGDYTFDDAGKLQALAGQLVVNGWKA